MDKKEKILTLYKAGLSISQISRELDIPYKTVSNLLNSRTRTDKKEKYKEEIIKLRQEFNSYDTIANKLQCAKSTVCYYCKKYVDNNKEIQDTLVKNAAEKLKKYGSPRKGVQNEISKYTDEQLKNAVFTSYTITETLKKLKLNPYCRRSLFKRIKTLGLSTDHFLGSRHFHSGKSVETIGDAKCRKRRLIKDRGCSCEECGISEWRDHKVTLHIHHLNEDNTDNRAENLKLLCPNCHYCIYHAKKNKIDDKTDTMDIMPPNL